MKDKITNIIIAVVFALFLSVGAFIGAGWALDSRIDSRIEKEFHAVHKDSERIREIEKLVIRIEENIKTLNKSLSECNCK